MYRNNLFTLSVILFITMLLQSCNTKQKNPTESSSTFEKDNLVAWCIVPFDANKRTPQQRAEMLSELGFTKMAWDWRMEHISQLEEEIMVLRENNIELSAVWFWIDNNLNEGFLPHQQEIFNILERTNTKTTFWVSFPDLYFEIYDHEPQKIELAAQNIRILNTRAEELGCKVALYNHTGWFGEPENQVKIIERIGSDNVGIVYNFHHGHTHIDRFAELLKIMQPHLWTINLNGMNPDGPKILDIGKGEKEKAMIQTILDSDFIGTIGIIGHTDGEDIRPVLERNLSGLEQIMTELAN